MRRDAIFYQIFKRFPELLATLIDLPPEQAQGYRFESVEVKEPSFRIDGVFIPPYHAIRQLVCFCEAQFQKDDTLYHRFFSEIFLFLYRNHPRFKDWYGLLIFPSRGLEPSDTTIHQALLNSPNVKRIYLDELTAEESTAIGIRLMKLTILPEAQMAAQAKDLITEVQQTSPDILSTKEIIEIVTTIVVYKFATLSREEVEAMLGLTGMTLEETRVYQDAKEAGRQEGRQEGLQEGLEQGLAQGQQAALAATIPLLLQAGFTVEQIAQRTGIAIAQIQQVADQSPRS